MAIWRVHGDGVNVGPGEVVGPRERLSWPRTIGIGTQHVVAMFGATFLVPLITGFPPATTLFFSAGSSSPGCCSRSWDCSSTSPGRGGSTW